MNSKIREVCYIGLIAKIKIKKKNKKIKIRHGETAGDLAEGQLGQYSTPPEF